MKERRPLNKLEGPYLLICSQNKKVSKTEH